MTKRIVMVLLAAWIVGLAQPCEARPRHRKVQPAPEAATIPAPEQDVDSVSGRCNPAGEPTLAPRQQDVSPEESAPATEPVQRGGALGDVWSDRCDPSGQDHEVAPAPSTPKAESDEDDRPRTRRRHRREESEEDPRTEEKPAAPSGPILASITSREENVSGIQMKQSPWKNNNPGNIKEPKAGPWPGTLGYDGQGHAKFPTVEVGAMNLMACLMKNTSSGYYGTPSKMVGHYTTTEGDRTDYVTRIRQLTGFRPDERMILWRAGQPDKEKLFQLVQAVVTYERALGPLPAEVLEAAFQLLTGRKLV